MLSKSQLLSGKFLVAMPSLAGSEFESSLIYLFDHNPLEGAFGIVINHALEMTEGEVIKSLNKSFDAKHHDAPAFNGGPVDPERGFIIHNSSDLKRWEGQVDFADNISITTSSDILLAMTDNIVPHHLIALGYSGWDAQQLEQEIADNAWLVIDADPMDVFTQPWHQRLSFCLNLIGIKYEHLSAVAGHS